MLPHTALLTMSDLHYGKQTATFSPDVFAQRLKRVEQELRFYRATTLKATKKLIIAGLGDWNDGSGIYKTQAHHQAITNVDQQADELSQLVAAFIDSLAEVWPLVEFYSVPGNHGRTGSFAHEAANWDITTYRLTALRVKRPNVDMHLPEGEDMFIKRIGINGRTALLYHGHDIKSFSNIPWYGMQLRQSRWQGTETLGGFDMLCMGHFHTFGWWQISKVDMFLSGTMVTDDMWGLQCFGQESSSRWHLLAIAEDGSLPLMHTLDLRRI